MKEPEKGRSVSVARLFAEAKRLTGVERATFLGTACANDSTLLREVSSLLAASEQAADFLESGAPGGGLRTELDRSPIATELLGSGRRRASAPRTIGPYEILKWIGEGGMGVVYAAEHPTLHRRVAVKILRSTILPHHATRRFAREAALLARLEHRGIARIYDVGTDETSAGPVSWLAMELVEGRSLVEHADTNGLSTAQRLELLCRVCEAVTHAHAQGVVHRDLKPANILVTGGGQPKILDFGIARAIDVNPTPSTFHTRTGELLGTLPYMAPEQAAAANDLDERTDVYALGVIAFELLTGRLPHDIEGLPLPEAVGVIRDSDAERLGSVDASLRGDLDAIIGQALERDRGRRYASAGELVGDIRRHLENRPVIARPPSMPYRVTRFVQRHRNLVGTTLGVLGTLLTGIVLVVHLALGEAELRLRADGVADLALRNAQVARSHAAQARQDAYRAALSAASAALQDHDVRATREQLLATEEYLRGWEWRHLFARLDDRRSTFTGSASTRQELAWQDQRLLTSAGSYQVHQIDVVSGDQTLLQPNLPQQWWMDLSPDGTRALAKRDTGAFLVDLRAGNQRPLWTGPIGDNVSLRFGPRGEIAWLHHGSGDLAPPLRVFDGRDARLLSTVPIAGRIEHPALSRDGRLMWISRTTAHARQTGTAAELWSVADGTRIHELAGDSSPNVAAFSPDGRLVVAGFTDGRTRAWDLGTGGVLPWADDRAHGASVSDVEFDREGTRLAVGDEGGSARLLDGRDGSLAARLGEVTRAEHHARPSFSPDGRLLAIAGMHGSVRVASAIDGVEQFVLHGPEQSARDLRFSSDGRLLASVEGQGAGSIWEVGAAPGIVQRHDSYVYDVDFDPTGRRLASAGWDGKVRLCDPVSGLAIATLEARSGSTGFGYAAFSPDGGMLLSSNGDTPVVRDATTGEILATLPFSVANEPFAFNRQVTGLSWHPDGRLFAVSSHGRKLHLWRRHEDGSFEPVAWPIGAEEAEFSPDAHHLALAVGTSIEIWQVTPPYKVRVLSGHDAGIRNLAFSMNGRLLASASDDHTLRIWDVGTGREIAVLSAHTEKVYCAAFSPDGTRLASGGNDHRIRIWDTGTWQQLVVLRGHESYVHALEFSPDGRTLASGSGDATVRLWETDPLAVRIRARDERRTLEEELRPRVARLLKQSTDRRLAAERLVSLGLEGERQVVASDLLLRLSGTAGPSSADPGARRSLR